MATYRTGKYDYNALCDVCGFKFKASQLRKRWDGFMVCDADWEPRNILDFYRTRDDAHLLPFTRPDDPGDTVWTPVVTNVTSAGYTVSATYIVDDNNIVSYKIILTPTSGNTVGASATLSLPVGSVSTDRKGTCSTSLGRFLGTITNTAAIHIPNFTINPSPLETLMIAGQYLKA